MTKKEARKIAERATRYGHYRHGSTLSIDCPQCHNRITHVIDVWEKGNDTTKIRNELARHLYDGDCDLARGEI